MFTWRKRATIQQCLYMLRDATCAVLPAPLWKHRSCCKKSFKSHQVHVATNLLLCNQIVLSQW